MDKKYINFNINNYIQVRLTDAGRARLFENYQELKLPFKYKPPEEDKDGWSRWQAWVLIEQLGDGVSMGLDLLFEPEIRIEIE